MNRLVAIVPARFCNDEGLENKDILPFDGVNLLTHKLRQLKQVDGIDIIVSSENDDILKMGKTEGVECIKRPLELARSDASFGDFVEYICEIVKQEHIIWACVTSPLITPIIYRKAIDTYFEGLEKGFDSLVTVQRLQRYLMDENGAINFKPGRNVKIKNQVKPIYIFTNGISIAPRESMRGWKYTSGDIPYMFELGKKESIDICDEFDYECAKKFFHSKV